MIPRGVPWAAALLAVVASWTGARLYLHHAAVQRGVPVPAGEASAPNPGELTAQPEAPPAQIPERLPNFALEDLAGKLGVASPVFPFTVFTDRRGRIVALYLGELHKAQADLILGVVERLNEDRLPLADARRAITEGLNALQAKIPG